jgi:hypothetical protein
MSLVNGKDSPVLQMILEYKYSEYTYQDIIKGITICQNFTYWLLLVVILIKAGK